MSTKPKPKIINKKTTITKRAPQSDIGSVPRKAPIPYNVNHIHLWPHIQVWTPLSHCHAYEQGGLPSTPESVLQSLTVFRHSEGIWGIWPSLVLRHREKVILVTLISHREWLRHWDEKKCPGREATGHELQMPCSRSRAFVLTPWVTDTRYWSGWSISEEPPRRKLPHAPHPPTNLSLTRVHCQLHKEGGA